MAMQDSQNKLNGSSKSAERKKRLILGGRTYTIDEDDISVIAPENGKAKATENDKRTPSTGSPIPSKASDLGVRSDKIPEKGEKTVKDISTRYNRVFNDNGILFYITEYQGTFILNLITLFQGS